MAKVNPGCKSGVFPIQNRKSIFLNRRERSGRREISYKAA
jgi:hypothetical protein